MKGAVPLALLVLAAGCVSPGADLDALGGRSPGEILPHLELSDAHDHADADAHRVAWNVAFLGHHPVASDVAKLGEYNQIWIQGTRAFMSAHHLENGSAPGLAVFNISGDDPVLTATLETPDLTVIDVHVTDDGKYAILAGHAYKPLEDRTPSQVRTFCTAVPAFTEVCAPYVPYGLLLVDVSDEAAPRIAATWTSAPSGAHTAKIATYDDGYYVFSTSYGLHRAGRVGSHVEILKVEETPLGTKLVPVSEFFASRPAGPDGQARANVHDTFIADHPTAGRLMWVSYWDGGVVLVDVNDPMRPRELSEWREFDPVLYGNIHFARPVGMIGERHISFAAPEFQSAEHAGEAYVLDTTDPTAPTLLAKWVLPGDPLNDGNYRFSPHNFDPLGTKLVYAHYHGGVWVLDLAKPEAPVVKGYVFPTLPEELGPYEGAMDAPNVWAALWAPDGTIYASDRGTGLYHYRLVSEEPGTPPYEAALAAMGG